MRAKKNLTLIMVSSMILLLLWQSQVIVNTNSSIQEDFLPVLNAVPIIVIDEDSDFSVFPGTGTEEDPYIIEGFDVEIPTVDEIGIIVTGTTMHFEIRNNEISKGYMGAGDGDIGISIRDVAPNTANVSNNHISNFDVGIYAELAEGIIIEENICQMIDKASIRLEFSPYARVENNVIFSLYSPLMKSENSFENTLHGSLSDIYNGMHLDHCSDSNITGNYMDLDSFITNYGTGIKVQYSDRILIGFNLVKNIRLDWTEYEQNEMAGIYLQVVSYATIFNNTVEETDKANLLTTSCDNLLISNNTFSESEVNGITLKTTTNSNITHNIIHHSPSFGISIGTVSSNILIHHNHFIDNNIGGSQASDLGSNNVWYDSVTLEGNWWNDWTGGDYEISGTAGSFDLYPLGEPVVISEFSQQQSIIFLSLLCSAIILTVTIIRKKKKQ